MVFFVFQGGTIKCGRGVGVCFTGAFFSMLKPSFHGKTPCISIRGKNSTFLLIIHEEIYITTLIVEPFLSSYGLLMR